jgi:hypothetical protein
MTRRTAFKLTAMTLGLARYIKPLATVIFAVATSPVFLAPTLVHAQALKECVEGVYALEEYKTEGQVFKPPQIFGSLMIMNGTVMYIFHDRTKQSAETSFVGIGRYTLSPTTIAYRYDTFSTFKNVNGTVSESRRLPWEDMRLYTSVLEQDGMHLRNVSTMTDILCSSDAFLYTFGQDYRKYRRVRSDK